MDNPRHNTRDIYPATGTEITAKSWLTEAPLRMLMNNLHPDVAENPHELVVYGGIGRAARTWQDFDRICAAQGVDFRAPLQTSTPLRAVVACLRTKVATMGDDRYMAPDLAAAANLIATGALAQASALTLPTL